MTKLIWKNTGLANGVGLTGANHFADDGTTLATHTPGAGNSIQSYTADYSSAPDSIRQVGAGTNTPSSAFPFASTCSAGRVSVKRKIGALTGTTWQWIKFLDAANNLLFRVGSDTTGKIYMFPSAGTGTITENRWNRWEIVFNQGSSSSNGAVRVNLFNNNNEGTPDCVFSSSAYNLNFANPVAKIDCGQSSAFAFTQYLDEIQTENLSPLSVGALPSDIGPIPVPSLGGWQLGSIAMGS